MKGNFKAKHALTVLANPQLKNEAASFLPKLQGFAITILQEIDAADQANVARGVVGGMALLTVKLACDHGEWTPWMEKNITGRSTRRCQHLMKLALHFMEKMKVDRHELLALGSGTSIAKSNKAAALSLKAKIEKFADGRSLTELLIARGIESAPAPDDDAEQESSGGGGTTLKAEPANFMTDVAEWLLNLRNKTTDPENLKTVPKRDLKALQKQVADYHHDLDKAVAALSQK